MFFEGSSKNIWHSSKLINISPFFSYKSVINPIFCSFLILVTDKLSFTFRLYSLAIPSIWKVPTLSVDILVSFQFTLTLVVWLLIFIGTSGGRVYFEPTDAEALIIVV